MLIEGFTRVKIGDDGHGEIERYLPTGRLLWTMPIFVSSEQRMKLARATPADMPGIARAPELPPYVLPPPVSTVKPALAGLGMVADGDHRLGRF